MNKEDLGDVLAYGEGGVKSHDPIPLTMVRRWIANDDLETAGALYALMNMDEFRKRIDPEIQPSEHRDFTLNYFSRCLKEDPDGDWSDSRYQVCRDLVSIFKKNWKNSPQARDRLNFLKDWMRSEYQNGDAAVQTALINGVFEHLFELPDVAKFFEDWKADEIMSSAYNKALEWGNPR